MREICIAAIGTRGDLFPMLALADILKSDNAIRIISSPDHMPLLTGKGFDCLPVGDDFSGVVSSGDVALFRKQIEAQFDCYPAVWEAADMIIGAGLFYAGRTLAEYYGKPYYHLFYTPQVLKSDHYAPAGSKRPFRSRLHNRLLWLKSTGESDYLLKTLINRKRGALNLKPIRSVYEYFIDQPDTVIALDERLAKIPQGYATRIKQIHTLQYEDTAPLDGALRSFLDQGEKSVVVSFGSAEYAVKEYEKLLKQTMDAIGSLGFRMVVLSRTIPAAYTNNKRIFSCPYAPHAALLPRAEAIVHHGGIGTITAALKSGTPQIIVPQVMDQHYWAEIVQRNGWGKAVAGDDRQYSTKLLDAIKAIRRVSKIRENVMEISCLMNSVQYREEGMGKLRNALPACFFRNPALGIAVSISSGVGLQYILDSEEKEEKEKAKSVIVELQDKH